MRTFTRVCFNDASFRNTQFDYLHWPSPAIREYDAKLLLAYWLARAPAVDSNATVKTKFVYPQAKVAQISWDPVTNTITPDTQLPGWVFNTRLVAKPDQLIKRRGKAGLLALNKTWDEAREWIAQRAGKPQQVSDRFLLRWRRSFFFFSLAGSIIPFPKIYRLILSHCIMRPCALGWVHMTCLPQRVMHVLQLQFNRKPKALVDYDGGGVLSIICFACAYNSFWHLTSTSLLSILI